jgi:hypothetical protein
MALSLITAGVAAVVDVFSDTSIEILVDSNDVPASFTSTINVEPVGAVVTDARTSVRVKAAGALSVSLAVPVVNAVVSSEAAP